MFAGGGGGGGWRGRPRDCPPGALGLSCPQYSKVSNSTRSGPEYLYSPGMCADG